MNKAIMIGMIGLLMISVAGAEWIQQLSEETFSGLTRQQLIDGLNIQYEGASINKPDITAKFSYNTIIEDNDEYWVVRKTMEAKLSYRLVVYCLSNYNGNICQQQLVNNPEQLNVTINGKEYTFDPIQYQVIDHMNAELGRIKKMQEELYDEQMMQTILSGMNPQIPVIT